MLLMIITVLAVVGLCLGSFVNAVVWRLHEQHVEKTKKKPNRKYLEKLSISMGRSVCPSCKHVLSASELIPVLSWITLGGKCRHCHRPISWHYPVVELLTAVLFVASYIWWPVPFDAAEKLVFVLWLALLAGLIALLVYDAYWKILPNRLIYPLTVLASGMALINVTISDRPLASLLNLVGAVVLGGGIFYVLFQVSEGKWIGGGDVRLGWLLGLVSATPARSLLFIFLAALGGSLFSLPLMASRRLKRNSVIPFGPFLIIGLIIVQLFGADVLHWYRHTFITF
jgi:leader peptidase (prepilin peptidase) / N-methyltransferase